MYFVPPSSSFLIFFLTNRAETEEWKEQLHAPPKDTRTKTEVQPFHSPSSPKQILPLSLSRYFTSTNRLRLFALCLDSHFDILAYLFVFAPDSFRM